MMNNTENILIWTRFEENYKNIIKHSIHHIMIGGLQGRQEQLLKRLSSLCGYITLPFFKSF